MSGHAHADCVPPILSVCAALPVMVAVAAGLVPLCACRSPGMSVPGVALRSVAAFASRYTSVYTVVVVYVYLP